MSSFVTAKLALLVASMRAGGARVGVGDLITAHRALAAVDASSRDESFLALRAALCKRHSDLEVFIAAFDATFGAEPSTVREPVELPEAAKLVVPRIAVPPSPGDTGPPPTEPDAPVPSAWSEVELLREVDFAEMSDKERALATRLVRRIAVAGPMRRSRRLRSTRRRGGHPDLRRTVRSSLRYAGEPIERHWREPRERQRPVVLVCDVSGSMDPYARMLLHYMQAWVAARRRVEAFVFGTRLTRVTRELAGRDPNAAVARAAGARAGWAGGTPVGAAPAGVEPGHRPRHRGGAGGGSGGAARGAARRWGGCPGGGAAAGGGGGGRWGWGGGGPGATPTGGPRRGRARAAARTA